MEGDGAPSQAAGGGREAEVSGQWPAVVDGMGRDALQVLLEQGNRNRLHAHTCDACGEAGLPCCQLPCAWRPFDRDAEGVRWRCGFCRMADRIARELEGA